jgi:D-methionine transport system ATP-binding protein
MIVVDGLTKTFGSEGRRIRALDGVSLRVGTARICGVLGDSGAGKSTLAACLAGSETPDAGVIRVGGTDLGLSAGNRNRAATRQVAVMPGDATLVRGRTVAGNAAVPLELAGLGGPERRRRVGEVLDLADLTELAGHDVRGLTEGQLARLNLARGLAIEPAVLVADEPARTGEHASSVYVALERARSELGITVLLATQDVIGLRAACDEVAILERGRVIESGSLVSLAADPGSLTSAAVVPTVEAPAGGGHQRTAEIVLVGAAALRTTLPEARRRFGARIDVLGLQRAHLGETPLARYLLGVSGTRGEAAIRWLTERCRLCPSGTRPAPDPGVRVAA